MFRAICAYRKVTTDVTVIFTGVPIIDVLIDVRVKKESDKHHLQKSKRHTLKL